VHRYTDRHNDGLTVLILFCSESSV